MIDGSQLVMNNNTVASNHQPTVSSLSRGAGIYAASGGNPSANGYNNIVYFNEAYSNHNVYGNVNFTYSCAPSGLSGTGNITSNPQLVSEPYHNYELQPNSPCIDTGDPNSPLDPDGTRADMGALYYPQTQAEILSVSPSSLTFNAEAGGSNPSNQTFQISNSGVGTFNYTISESIAWLTVSPMSGGPVPPTATETVSVNISGLSPGTYEGDITITAPGASGSPQTVHVTLEILGNPTLSLSPNNLTFVAEIGGLNPPNQSFQISNSGGGSFSYSIS